MFTPVYDEAGHRGPLRRAHDPHLVPAATAAQRAHLPGAAAALPGGHRVVRPVGLRPRRVELQRLGARGDLRRATPCTSATATTRSATPGTSATARSPSAATRSRRASLRGLFRRWREWDWIAAQRVDRYLTNSRTTQARIQSYFGRESTVVHPPVETEPLRARPGGRPLPVLSELMPHKRIEEAVRAFNRLGLPLVVVGDGPDGAPPAPRCAGPNVTLHRPRRRRRGRAPARHLPRVRGDRVEEFGIAAVEAQAAGRPVIARRGGGALETVIEGVTGCFWEGGPDELAAAVRASTTGDRPRSVRRQRAALHAERLSHGARPRGRPRTGSGAGVRLRVERPRGARSAPAPHARHATLAWRNNPS